MFTKYIIPLIALTGAIFAVLFVRAGNKPVPASQPVALPAQASYQAQIAGAGLVESSTENISVGTVMPGIVNEVLVRVGDEVKASQPLFRIDDRDLRAQLIVRQAALESAKVSVEVEKATLSDLENQLAMYKNVSDTRAITQEELDRRQFAVLRQRARVASADAEVKMAEAQIQQTQTDLDRAIVRAPVDARVLQVKIRKGEFAQAGMLATPLMLLGDTRTLHVRVDIDENDAWRLKPGARARASLRGNRDLAVDLSFVRTEPYVVPKKSLTGDSTERVDTRVLQVLYSFPQSALPVYVGQQMDVFIEADSVPDRSTKPVTQEKEAK